MRKQKFSNMDYPVLYENLKTLNKSKNGKDESKTQREKSVMI